jgi:hypothetical protein
MEGFQPTLPKGVREAGERADALIKGLQQEEGKTAPAPADPPAEDPSTSTVTDPTPAPEATGTPAEPQAPGSDHAWEQRYRVLQSKYDAEVPRYARELREAKGQIHDLMQQMEELKVKASEPPAQPLDPAAYEEYGEEFGGLVKIVNELQTEVQSLKAENANLKQGVDGVQRHTAQSAATQFEAEMERLAPGWQAQNNDQAFIGWLQEEDPFSGEPRLSMLQRHYGRLDAKKCATFFQAYQRESGKTYGSGTAAPGGKSQAAPAPSLSPEQFVSPGKSRESGGPPPAPAAKVWSGAEITRFFEDKRKGKYTEEEARRLEMDILRAPTEGRVRR